MVTFLEFPITRVFFWGLVCEYTVTSVVPVACSRNGQSGSVFAYCGEDFTGPDSSLHRQVFRESKGSGRSLRRRGYPAVGRRERATLNRKPQKRKAPPATTVGEVWGVALFQIRVFGCCGSRSLGLGVGFVRMPGASFSTLRCHTCCGVSCASEQSIYAQTRD